MTLSLCTSTVVIVMTTTYKKREVLSEP